LALRFPVFFFRNFKTFVCVSNPLSDSCENEAPYRHCGFMSVISISPSNSHSRPSSGFPVQPVHLNGELLLSGPRGVPNITTESLIDDINIRPIQKLELLFYSFSPGQLDRHWLLRRQRAEPGRNRHRLWRSVRCTDAAGDARTNDGASRNASPEHAANCAASTTAAFISMTADAQATTTLSGRAVLSRPSERRSCVDERRRRVRVRWRAIVLLCQHRSYCQSTTHALLTRSRATCA
jgi:hypothetical protein